MNHHHPYLLYFLEASLLGHTHPLYGTLLYCTQYRLETHHSIAYLYKALEHNAHRSHLSLGLYGLP